MPAPALSISVQSDLLVLALGRRCPGHATKLAPHTKLLLMAMCAIILSSFPTWSSHRAGHPRSEVRGTCRSVDLLEICASAAWAGHGVEFGHRRGSPGELVLADEMALTNLEIHLAPTAHGDAAHGSADWGRRASSLVAVLVNPNGRDEHWRCASHYAGAMREARSQYAQGICERWRLTDFRWYCLFSGGRHGDAGPGFMLLYRAYCAPIERHSPWPRHQYGDQRLTTQRRRPTLEWKEGHNHDNDTRLVNRCTQFEASVCSAAAFSSRWSVAGRVYART